MKKFYVAFLFLFLFSFAHAQESSFITTWEVDGFISSITIPTEGSGYDYSIDFGDGTVQNNVSGDISHTYNSAGIYTVSISGDFPRVYFNGSGDANKIQSVDQWGNIQWQNMRSAFQGCDYLKINAADTPDLSQVTDLSYMFQGCKDFNSDINNWDVSNVTDMSHMFSGSDYSSVIFNQPLNNWDVSNVTNMSEMFYRATSFNQSINNWDVSNVTNMENMFKGTVSFKQAIDNWDVSNVTNMESMFFSNSGFNQSINNWDVSSVTDMSEMFYGATSFNQSINNWDVSSVTDMSEMFTGATSFNQSLNNWDVSNVIDMSEMFYRATSFNQPLNNWDVSSVNDMSGMFSSLVDYKPNIFNQPLNNWDVSNVLSMQGMFHNAEYFNQSLESWDVSNVTNMSGMFSFARSFNKPINTWEVTNVTDMSDMFYKAYSLNQNISSWNFNTEVNLDNFLSYCKLDITNYDMLLEQFQALDLANKSLGARDLIYCDENIHDILVNNNGWTISDDDLFHNCGETYSSDAFVIRWEVSNDTNDGTFNIWSSNTGNNFTIDFGDGTIYTDDEPNTQYGHNYNSDGIYQIVITGDLPNLNFMDDEIRSVEQWGNIEWQSMESAFSGCSKLVINATDTPDLSQVTNMSRMFQGCTILNSNINDWDVSNVTTMGKMFLGADNYNQPLNNWDVSNVTYMRSMFSLAKSFNQSLNNWNVSNVNDMRNMFQEAESFNQSLNDWDVSTVTTMEKMFLGAYKYNQSLNNWDVSNVNDMRNMFQEAESFNQSLNNWDVSNVSSMHKMFYDTEDFNQGLNDWDVSNVIDMSFMFASSSVFNQPLDDWDVSNVQNMSYMFSAAVNFNKPLNDWNVSNVYEMSDMFSTASSFNQPLNSWDVSQVPTSMDGMFEEAISFNQPLNEWDVSQVVEMRYMFYGAESFNRDLSSWNFSANVYLNNLVSYTDLNIQNYDALLARFVDLELQDKNITVIGLEYCNEFIHSQLINDLNWSLYGDSLAEDCSSFNLISGNISYDENNDGCDEDDVPFNNLVVNISNENYDFGKIVDEFAGFKFYLEEGTYDVKVLNLPDYYSATPEISTVDFIEGSASANQEQVDFCITANQTVQDLNITLLPINQARPGFEAEYQLVIENRGTQTANEATVNLTFDDSKQSFTEASESPSAETANSLTFEINDLAPFGSQTIDFTMQTFEPPTVSGEDLLAFTATVTPNESDYTPEDNTFEFEQVVVNSFDPNDKQVLQGDEIYEEQTDEYLDYIIRFQNTGTASAINVRILDTLHPKLDWNTLQPISASDDYRVEITDGNQVEFIFDDINLPYEDENEPGSHGFIAYKIKPKDNVAIGDVITGDAGIYFDFNAPIITNTVSTEIVENLGVEEYSLGSQISFYPNPTKDFLNIQTAKNVQLESVTVYNLQGRELLNFQQNLKTINLEQLSAGMYILKIKTDRGTLNRQLIKQ